MGGEVDGDFAGLEPRHRLAGPPPQHGADTGGEFGDLEGFDDVVVGAEIEAMDAGVERVARRHHDDRGLDALSPGAGEHLEPVEFGKTEIEQGDAVSTTPQGFEREFAGGDAINRETFRPERRDERPRDHVVVFGEEDARASFCSAADCALAELNLRGEYSLALMRQTADDLWVRIRAAANG